MNNLVRNLDLRKEKSELLRALHLKYPDHQTDWGCLLAEILYGSTFVERTRAAFHFRGYRRGSHTFQSWLEDYDKRCSLTIKHDNASMLADREEEAFLWEIMSVIGLMKTHECLSYLTHVACEFSDVTLRANAVEAMSFTGRPLDIELLFSFLEPGVPTEIKVSALYSLVGRIKSSTHWQQFREISAELLRQENFMVRTFSIEVLKFRLENAEMLESLVADPDSKISECAQEALEFLHDWADEL